MKLRSNLRRFILAALAVVVVAGSAQAQFTGQRVPLGILVTNWDCGPCAPANQALDAYLPGQGNDVALIRVHGWWPGPYDPMYLANVAQSTWLIENTPTGSDYAPHLWLDNVVNLGSNGAGYVAGFEARKLVAAPLEIAVNYDIDNERVLATVHVLDSMPAGDYRLYVAVTEDNVLAEGTNGEPIHNQVFRRLYPDLDGVPIVNDIGDQEFTVETPLHSRWEFDQLRATVYVQEFDSGVVQNTGTMFLHDAATTAVEPVARASRPELQDAYPNPFNPRTTLRFTLAAAGPATLRVYDLAGRLVRTLVDGDRPAGTHEVVWLGDDDRGAALASGVYLVQLSTAGGVASQKVALAK